MPQTILSWQEIIGFLFFIVAVISPPVLICSRFLAWKLGRASLPSRLVLTLWVGFLLLEMACILEGYYLEPHWIELVTERLPMAKIKAGTTLRLIHLSDTHFEGRPLDWSRAEVLDMLEQARPDVICLTGDYLNDRSAGPEFSKFLARLPKIATTVAIEGNWDYRTPEFLNTFPDLGITLLHNEALSLSIKGQTITFVGTDLFSAPQLGEFLKGISSDSLVVAMNHLPDFYESGAALGVDLMLAGHTHGGQICLPWYGALITLARTGKRFEAGLYKVGNSWAHTSRGLGLEGGLAPRVRFWGRPEVTILDLASPERNAR